MAVGVLVVLPALAIAGPLAAQDDPPQATPLPALGDQSTDNEMPAVESDGAVLAQLIAFDRRQLALAEIARRKSPSQPVADHAKALVDDHTAWLARSEEIARAIGAQLPDPTPAQRAQDAAHEDRREALDDLGGTEFEKAWIAQLVADQAAMLAELDASQRMARNDDVLVHLRMQRGRLAAHLERARLLAAAPEP